MKVSQLIFANALFYFVITAMSLIMMIVIGILVFHFEMRGSWLTFGIFAVTSAIMVLGFGLLIGSWAKNEKQSAPLSNLISFPMMFLSGAFFPRFLFPEWLQGITGYIPLTSVIDGFRQIMTEHATLVTVMPQLLVIVVWTLVIYLCSIKLFRWQ